MSIVTIGINHKTTPLAIRERFSFNHDCASLALQDLMRLPSVNEAVLLSTCNRTEIYTISNNHFDLPHWLQHHGNLRETDIFSYCYHHQEIDAIKHLMRVASGLDSMIIGEPQILGQLKQAYHLAYEMGCVGKHFSQLFPMVFSVSKHIRSQTNIGRCPVSLAYAVTQLAKKHFQSLTDCRILFIGAGQINELIATYLTQQHVNSVIVANRTIEKAEQLAKPLQAHPIRIADIPAYISEVDIIVTATSSQLPILGKGLIERALRERHHKPMLLIDLAVPRDIEPEVAELNAVYFYNIDNLQTIVNQNLDSREQAAQQAEAMIDIHVQHYLKQLRVLNASDMIRDLRERMTHIRDHEMQKAQQMLANGHDPQQVLNWLARKLTNRFLHRPTVKLRDAAYHDQIDTLMLMKHIYDL